MQGHIMFSRSAHRMQFYLINDDGSKELRHVIDARNETVGPTDGVPYGHFGPCPPGDYVLGQPESRDEIAFGRFFTPLLDVHGNWAPHGRSEIGVHGGGSASPTPFAPQQGWYPTEGCIRLQNADNEQIFMPFVHTIQSAGGQVVFTVAP